MKMKAEVVWLVCLSWIGTVLGTEVSFSKRVFTLSTDNECLDHDYSDPKDTGSYLMSKKGSNSGQYTLSMDIQLVHYTASGDCFRAHPVFVECAEAALSNLKKAGKRAIIVGGYRVPSEVAGSTAEENVYAAAGTSLALMPESNNDDDLLIIARYFLHYCPAMLERIQRNLGIVMKVNTLHVFMGGPSDGPVFRVDGSKLTQANFTAEVVTAISQGLEVGKRASNCSRYAPLTSGQMFPVNATSAEGTVGKMDVPVSRYSVDFTRMVQYLGSTVQFENDERSASWCGLQNTSCVDCRSGIIDATVGQRCTARMMTARMSNVLVLLQKLTAMKLTDTVRVMKAWDENYEGHVANASSLHLEGRALLVTLASGNTNQLGVLSQLAMCAKADFVQHNGDHLLIAVQKQFGVKATEANFAQATMIRVEPPSSEDNLFKLPADFKASDLAEYPILDSDGREALQLASYTSVRHFLSSQTRYFRLNPIVVDCFSKLQNYFVKREDTDGPVTLEVLRGFMTTPERDLAFTVTDHRFVNGILGLSFEIRPKASQSPQNVSLATLARLAVTQCTPVFQDSEDSQIGVGLYKDRVYVDMRDSYKFWNPAGSFSSQVKSALEFKSYVTGLFNAARDGRNIEPDAPSEAKKLAETTLRQSTTYRYVTPERILRNRNVNVVGAKECVPTENTAFCQMSEPFRNSLLSHGWAEVAKKHSYHDVDEFKHAFFQCFGQCGTCLAGSIYENKLEHCSNFLHWAPFEMIPDGTAINLFPRERAHLRKCACQGSSVHCIEDSALFLVVVNVFEATFRPDPSSSVEEEMYPQTENPSPVAELLNHLYVTHHEGIAKIWIQDDSDITSMRVTLEKLMVYNRNVTEVKIYVKEPSTMGAVESVMRALILDWVTDSSPVFTRESVAPYAIEDMASHCRITSKRSIQQHNVRDEMIAKFNAQADRYLEYDL